MRLLLLLIGGSALLAGCTHRTVVYEDGPRTVLVEPAGTPVRVYPARTEYRTYYYDTGRYDEYGPRKLGEYHMR